MKRAILIGLLAAVTLAGQVCRIEDYSTCDTSTSPTLKSFVQSSATAFPSAGNWATGRPQPHIALSAEIKPLSQTYMLDDPPTCGGLTPTGTCHFNVIGDIHSGAIGYVYSMTAAQPNGVGLQDVDINLWMAPFFEDTSWAAACTTFGGGSCSPTISGGQAAWWKNALDTYDAVFAYMAAHKINVHVAPEVSGDVLTACHITRGGGPLPTPLNYTELQLQRCMNPLLAVIAKRYTIQDFSVLHEPCGVLRVVMAVSGGCALTVNDVDTLIASSSVAVRAYRKNPNMRVGAGATAGDIGGTPYNTSNPGNYFGDWILNLAASMDYYAIHAYPNTAQDLSRYTTGTLKSLGDMADAVPLNRDVLVDESSAGRWGPLSAATGEGGTFWGCGDQEWYTDGTFAEWATNVIGRWAPGHRISRWSLFPSDPLIQRTRDHANSHCSLGVDNYPYWLVPYFGQVSPDGLMYGSLATRLSIQGPATHTGRTTMGPKTP